MDSCRPLISNSPLSETAASRVVDGSLVGDLAALGDGIRTKAGDSHDPLFADNASALVGDGLLVASLGGGSLQQTGAGTSSQGDGCNVSLAAGPVDSAWITAKKARRDTDIDRVFAELGQDELLDSANIWLNLAATGVGGRRHA